MISKQEAEEYISQIAANKLGLSRSEALTGSDPAYWRACLMYGFFGLQDKPHFKAIIEALESPAIAGEYMRKANTLERASAVIPDVGINVERPEKMGEAAAMEPTLPKDEVDALLADIAEAVGAKEYVRLPSGSIDSLESIPIVSPEIEYLNSPFSYIVNIPGIDLEEITEEDLRFLAEHKAKQANGGG